MQCRSFHPRLHRPGVNGFSFRLKVLESWVYGLGFRGLGVGGLGFRGSGFESGSTAVAQRCQASKESWKATRDS